MEIPRVTGTCAECCFEFDLKFGLACPRCHNEVWLMNAYEPEPFSVPHVLTEEATAHHAECAACAVEAEVGWLDGLYRLQDPRV